MKIEWKLLEQWAKNMQRKSDRFKVTFTIDYTRRRRQINQVQDRMIFGDTSVNSKPIFLKFSKGHFLFKS